MLRPKVLVFMLPLLLPIGQPRTSVNGLSGADADSQAGDGAIGWIDSDADAGDDGNSFRRRSLTGFGRAVSARCAGSHTPQINRPQPPCDVAAFMLTPGRTRPRTVSRPPGHPPRDGPASLKACHAAPCRPAVLTHAAPLALAAAVAALHAVGCTSARAGDTSASTPLRPPASVDPVGPRFRRRAGRTTARSAGSRRGGPPHPHLAGAHAQHSRPAGRRNHPLRRPGLGPRRRHDPARPPAFNVAFDRLKTLDGPLEAVDRRYVYDGRWLLDLDGEARTATRRELNAARADPRANPNDRSDLEFGDGPFLVPLNLRKARVLSRFEASLAEPDANDDPEGDATDHLVLIPRATTEIDAVRLDLWFDRVTRLPRRASSTQADGDQTVVDLFEVDLNPTLPDGGFDTALPGEPGWELQTVPLGGSVGPSGAANENQLNGQRRRPSPTNTHETPAALTPRHRPCVPTPRAAGRGCRCPPRPVDFSPPAPALRAWARTPRWGTTPAPPS